MEQLLAQAIDGLLNYGPLGILLVLVIGGILIPKNFFDREVKRGDDATATASKTAESLTGVSSAIKEVASSLATSINGVVAILGAIKEEQSKTRDEIRALRDEVISIKRGT